MASKHLARLAEDLGWLSHGDSFAGEAQKCLFTVTENDGHMSLFFYIPNVDEDSLTSILQYLKRNQKRLNILEHEFTDDYLLIVLRRTLIPVSDEKFTQLLLLISNLAREGQGDNPRKCAICGEQTTADEKGFYLDLYSYVHQGCLDQLSEDATSPVAVDHTNLEDATDTNAVSHVDLRGNLVTYTDADEDHVSIRDDEGALNAEAEQGDDVSDYQAVTSKDEQLDFLMELIRIPSIKGSQAAGAPFGVETQKALDHFLTRAKDDGFRTKDVDGYCGWIEYGPEDAEHMIAAVAHLDVVPVGEWTDAFEPYIDDDRLIGRGSIDDKGPAVSAYYALKTLKDEAYVPNHRLRLILGLDEESGSACMERYLETEEVPVAGFTPDADFPVIHAEKGMMRFEIHMSWTDTPSNALRFTKAVAGSRPNVIPGSANVELLTEDGKRENKTLEGVMGHASMPSKAKNAISLAMRNVSNRLSEAGVSHPFIDMYMNLINLEYNGEKFGIAQSDEISGPLTFNVGMIDLDESRAVLTCDIRYPVTSDYDTIRATIVEKLSVYGAKFELLSHSVPLYLPKDHELVSTLIRVYRQKTGSDEEALAIGGGTYARSIPNIVAYGPNFPGQEELAHQSGEYILLDTFFRSQEIYRDALRELDQVYSVSLD